MLPQLKREDTACQHTNPHYSIASYAYKITLVSPTVLFYTMYSVLQLRSTQRKYEEITMSMTYAQLANVINEMSNEEKRQLVTIYVTGVDEFYASSGIMITTEAKEDRLDEGHYFLKV